MMFRAVSITTALIASSTHAALIEGHVTADNHYAIFTETESVVSRIGGNETGAGGTSGPYNWSAAESWSFEAGERLFIAAWSDDHVAQGLLASLTVDGETLNSGDSRWRVYATGEDRDTGDPWPEASAIADYVQIADDQDLWGDVVAGSANLPSTAPWGMIDNISTDAHWMWNSTLDGGSPFTGGADHDEMLIFSFTTVPAPSALTLLGVAVVGPRRRRA